MILVEGCLVGYMYREESDLDVDSGWRFFSGLETQEYADNPDHFALYDLNTIANYDPEITPFLVSPIGSAFERKDGDGPFEPVILDPPTS